MDRRLLLLVVLALQAAVAPADVDLAALWDHSDPAVSETRFREALAAAQGDDALVLTTQIARTYQLRLQFDDARAVLAGIADDIEAAGPEARARYWLELGRSYVSHRHPPELVTESARAQAREAFAEGLTVARQARLDALAIDIIHMCAFVETDREAQLRCNQEALQVALSSDQPDARRWEASVRSNLGESLFEIGRYPEALEEFSRSSSLYAARADAAGNLDSRWHEGRTLRLLGRTAEALAVQAAVESEWAKRGESRRYVFEELELLHRAQDNLTLADRYARLAAEAPQ